MSDGAFFTIHATYSASSLAWQAQQQQQRHLVLVVQGGAKEVALHPQLLRRGTEQAGRLAMLLVSGKSRLLLLRQQNFISCCASQPCCWP